MNSDSCKKGETFNFCRIWTKKNYWNSTDCCMSEQRKVSSELNKSGATDCQFFSHFKFSICTNLNYSKLCFDGLVSEVEKK